MCEHVCACVLYIFWNLSLLHHNKQRMCMRDKKKKSQIHLVLCKFVWASKDECVCVMEWKGLWEDTPPVGILISTGLCLWTPHVGLLTDFRSPAPANKEPYTNSRHTVTLLPPLLPPHQDPHRWELKRPPPCTDISFSRN